MFYFDKEIDSIKIKHVYFFEGFFSVDKTAIANTMMPISSPQRNFLCVSSADFAYV